MKSFFRSLAAVAVLGVLALATQPASANDNFNFYETPMSEAQLSVYEPLAATFLVADEYEYGHSFAVANYGSPLPEAERMSMTCTDYAEMGSDFAEYVVCQVGDKRLYLRLTPD